MDPIVDDQVPTVQVWHKEAPDVAEYDPEPQLMQLDVEIAVIVALYVPALHRVHAREPADAQLPGGQAAQTCCKTPGDYV